MSPARRPTSAPPWASTLLAALCCLGAACASAPDPRAELWRQDPLTALPDGARWVQQVAPYTLEDLRWLERATQQLAPLSDSSARLALARAWVDALLWAEIAQDGPRLDALERLAEGFSAGQAPWPWVGGLLDDLDADGPLRAALDDGRALVRALGERRLDADYHQTLDRLTSSAWAHEARAARLLDLEEALGELQPLPPEQRAEPLLEALGAHLAAPEGCPSVGCEGRDGGALGARLRALLEQGARDREALRGDGPTPLSLALGPALEALWARAGGALVGAPLAGPRLGLGVALPTSSGRALEGAAGRWVVLRDGWLLVGGGPLWGVDERGTTRADVALGWDLPGRPALDLDALGGDQGARAHAVEGLSAAWGEAGQLWGDPSVSLGVDREGSALRLVEGVALAREALGAGGGPWAVGVGCWSPERGRAWRRKVAFLGGAGQGGEQPWGVPEELAPKEVEVWLLGAEAVVRVGGREAWRGAPSEAGAPAAKAVGEDLGGAVVRLRPVGPEATVQGLLDALDALEARSLEVLVVR